MPEKLRYILIGGNGFLGKSLARHLLKEDVIIIGRSLPIVSKDDFQYYSVQQFSLEKITELLPSDFKYRVIDFSYNSISNTNPVYPGKDFSDNVNLVIENLRFARKLRAESYVYISSGGTVYGNAEENPIPETHVTNPISHYGIIKLASEKYVQMYCTQENINYYIVRPSNVYGPGQVPFRGQGIIPTALASVYKNRPVIIYGKGESIRDYIYVDDFCQWLILLIKSGKSNEIYNAGSGIGHSIMEIIDELKRVTSDSTQIKVQYVPERPFDVKLNILDNRKIMVATGISCSVLMQQGLSDTWNWIKTIH